ncbi:hypothetical protein [uncultured Lacinutrix sp.]|uniref:hypothetical protein n=1 Tax=uncultured Lacinutrix sp. TaxID=574032 RepID=UPI0026315347|nr:hypothetical protein [uncultured Lacinutrix sp.]
MKSLLIFFLFLSTYFTFGQTNADSLIIKNKIKVVKILNAKNKLVNEIRYDSLGKLIYRLDDDFAGYKNLKSTLTKIYDVNGNNIISVMTHSNFNKPTVWRHKYDDRGNKIATIDELNNNVFKQFYDEDNFMTMKLSYDENNKIRRKSTFEKTDDGNKIIEKIGRDSIPSRINTTTLDNNGNTIKSESLDGSSINSLINYFYKNNRLVKITYHGGYGRNYFYNSKNQLIRTSGYKEEQNVEITSSNEEFIYNKKGLIEFYRESRWSRDNSLSEYRYEYKYYE